MAQCIQCEDKNLGETNLNLFWTIIITYLLVENLIQWILNYVKKKIQNNIYGLSLS